MSGRDDDREWARRLGNLPRELAPRNDPWPAIVARIEAGEATPAPGRGRRWGPIAAAAMVAAAVGVTIWTNDHRQQPGLPEPPGAVAGRVVPAYAGSIQATEAEYVAALRELDALQRVGAQSGNPLAGALDPGWATMTEAEHELVAALRRYPDDVFIKERLLRLRARQLDLMRLIASADRATWRQTI